MKALTIVAVWFLLLDATLLTWAGVKMGRPGLVVAAAACAAGSFVPVLMWRRYRRALAELADARREMKREVESLRELLRNH